MFNLTLLRSVVEQFLKVLSLRHSRSVPRAFGAPSRSTCGKSGSVVKHETLTSTYS